MLTDQIRRPSGVAFNREVLLQAIDTVAAALDGKPVSEQAFTAAQIVIEVARNPIPHFYDPPPLDFSNIYRKD